MNRSLDELAKQKTKSVTKIQKNLNNEETIGAVYNFLQARVEVTFS